MIFSVEDTFPYFLVATKALIVAVSVIFLVSGLDDLFIDLCYMGKRLFRRFTACSSDIALDEARVMRAPEKPLAVMIPAWDESAVIRPMLENTLRTLRYGNFTLFVGTYPNDPATHKEVDDVVRRHPNVVRIVCPNNGPTNKADCLNWIYQGIRDYEREHAVRFEIFVMQDCEDVIHPLCYKLFNYLIPAKDMVQLPVMSLPPRWWDFTAGHYLDEFAQGHYKDMVVRELLDGNIPSAGVGTAFSRRACETVARCNRGALFSIHSLTEDYDFGLSFKQHGLTQCFVKFAVTRTVRARSLLTGGRRLKRVREYVGVREYFPSRLGASIRQKSRWVVGIVFQGWATLGWRGGLARKYMLYRDRKALITNIANMLGYVVVAVVTGFWLASTYAESCPCYPPLVEPGSPTWYIILANTALFSWRLGLRAYCVARIHGWEQSLLSAPRIVWGNVVNFAATLRAVKLYLTYVRTGRNITWDKTAHQYPTTPGR